VFTARYGLNLFVQFRLIVVFFQTVPLFGLLVAVLSPQKPGFDLKTDHVRPVMDQVALVQVSFLVLLFPLSVPFHQRSTPIFNYMLLLTEGQMNEFRKTFKNNAL